MVFSFLLLFSNVETEIIIGRVFEFIEERIGHVRAIAKRVGYKTLRSFEIAFLKKVGVSPTQYQKQHKPDGFVLWKHHQDGSIAVDISISEPNDNK